MSTNGVVELLVVVSGQADGFSDVSGEVAFPVDEVSDV